MIESRIDQLRALMAQHQVSGYLVPSNDQYMNEYTPPYAQRLSYISGFSGSSGLAIILSCRPGLFFTDGRYTQQSQQQLDPELFKIFNWQELAQITWQSYLDEQLPIAYDPQLFTRAQLKIFTRLNLQPLTGNLIDQIWHDRPPRPESLVSLYPLEFAGQSFIDKIEVIRQTLFEHQAGWLLISAADSICWLLNLRARDVEHSPLMLGTVLLTKTQIYLFIRSNQSFQAIIQERPGLIIRPEEDLTDALRKVDQKILVDENFTSMLIIDLLAGRPVEKINDPCRLLKACKNAVEINQAAAAHVKDAVAICEFLARLAGWALSNQTEYDLSCALTELRAQQAGYVMDSFPTICGFNANSAIIHYHPKQSTASLITGSGILLIDSGAQYLGATTDVTRTVAIGPPAHQHKIRYTQVLKGHIALGSVKFPANICGANLDVLARQFLWQDYQDYPHGTGHGVGSFLSVHEGPQNISLNNRTILQPGMILSNEPGYYLPGEFGLRIENLMYVQTASQPNYLEFIALTLVPYAAELIHYASLSSFEFAYIKQYYQQIHRQIYHLLSAGGRTWLLQQMAGISSC